LSNGGLNQAARRRRWATRTVRLNELDERLVEIGQEISADVSTVVLAAIEPRLAALESKAGTAVGANGDTIVVDTNGVATVGEMLLSDPTWDRGPQIAIQAASPKLRRKRRRLRQLRVELANRRRYGGVDGHERQSREFIAVCDELVRVEHQILLAQWRRA
jgi:hypothetical protein